MSVLDVFGVAMRAGLELDLVGLLVFVVVFSFVCLWAMVWSAWQRHVAGGAVVRSGGRSAHRRKPRR